MFASLKECKSRTKFEQPEKMWNKNRNSVKIKISWRDIVSLVLGEFNKPNFFLLNLKVSMIRHLSLLRCICKTTVLFIRQTRKVSDKKVTPGVVKMSNKALCKDIHE